MKKTLLNLVTASLVLIYSISMAQPNLTATGINAVVGESFTLNSYTAVAVSPGSAGASQTWNLTSMSGTPLGLTSIVAASSTTYGSSFTNANIAWNTSGSGLSYFKTSSTAMQGYGTVTASGSVIMPYSNPEDYLHFPFNYNNTFSDTWATQFLSGGYTFYRTGTTTVTADGYGTLITPTATYTNVMRVHMVQDYRDSTYIGMPYIITYNNDEYVWYKEGTHYQIATIYTLTSSSGGLYYGGSYVAGSTGIDNSSDFISSSSLFPNPATDKVTIDFTLTENKEVNVQMLNATGQQVIMNQNAKGNRGLNTIQLDVANLSEGIYFAKITLDGNIATTKRFVISK